MKEIRIFVASSKELNYARNAISFFAISHEHEFEDKGVRIRLSKWEYVDPSMTKARTEDRYLEEMYNSDAVIVLFKNIIGKYTKEEWQNAIDVESQGQNRLKVHRLLFSEEQGTTPTPELQSFRSSLPPNSYGVFSSLDDLEKEFLSLIDSLISTDLPASVNSEEQQTVSAFVAADDELAIDRNAFFDSIINLNEILSRRGLRIKLRYYDGSNHSEIMETSDMALVLYHTTNSSFGERQIQEAYTRTMNDRNPRRLYVFFKDEDDSKLDIEFTKFRDGFVEKMGHFYCRFENVDTLKLNFLLSLENVFGDGIRFARLDGNVVKVDEEDVAELQHIPMVANNGGLNDLFSKAEKLSAAFEAQRELCRKEPENSQAYSRLLTISTAKNELDEKINQELSRSFDLARRIAVISAKEANETISQARELLNQGCISEALALLDDNSSSIDDLLNDILGLDQMMEAKLKQLEASIEVELFKADTILAYANISMEDRFLKVEHIYKSLVESVENILINKKPHLLVKILLSFASFYKTNGDTNSPIALLEKGLKVFNTMPEMAQKDYNLDISEVYVELADCLHSNNRLDLAEKNYLLALELYSNKNINLIYKAKCLNKLAILHRETNKLQLSEKEQLDALNICLSSNNICPEERDVLYSKILNDLAFLYVTLNRLNDAEQNYIKSLRLRRQLALDNSIKYKEDVASTLNNLANLHRTTNKLSEAEIEFSESIEIRKELSEDNPIRFSVLIAESMNDLALLLAFTNRHAEAIEKYHEALKIRRSLSNINFPKYAPIVANTLNNMANVFRVQKQLDEAEKCFVEALEIRRSLASSYPEKFDEYVAQTLNDLAILHSGTNRIRDAEKEYKESLEIRERLANENPTKFNPFVANTLHNLGNLHKRMNDNAAAENDYIMSLQIRRVLASLNPSKFDEKVALSLNNLGDLYLQLNRLNESMEALVEAMNIRRRLAEISFEKFAPDFSWTLYMLGKLYEAQLDNDKAKECFVEALGILNRLNGCSSNKYKETISKLEQSLNKL